MFGILIFILEFISMGILLYLHVNIILSFIISSCFVLICYSIILHVIGILQRKPLDSDCDPHKYLKTIERYERRHKKNERMLPILAINYAVGHMSLGDFQKAREYLEGIDKNYLTEKSGSYLTYIIDIIICYYELGEIEKAEVLYETELVRLCPFQKRLRQSIDILIGERYYFLGEYKLSYEHLKKLSLRELNKRQYLGVLYRLGQIEMINGEKEQATKRFTKIVKFGNQLGIAALSKELLNDMDVHS